MASCFPHRCLATLALVCAGGAALLLGAGMTALIERYVSPDHVVEAWTRALLWTVRVRLMLIGAGALLAGWALGRVSFWERLRRLNAHPRSWTVVAGLIVAYAVAGLYIDPYLVSDLRPTPDAVEYAVSARQLMMTGSYTIPVGETAFPPRTPFGYPLLIIPFYWVFGSELSNAVLCSLVLVALTTGLVYRTGERVWGRTAGVTAALLTLSSPAVIDASRSVMSESAAMLGIALVAWLLIRIVERERPAWVWGLLGLCVGAGTVIRFSNVLLLAPAAFIVLLSYRGRPRSLVAALASLCAGCAVALAPLLIYQAKTFGGMFRTGYAFWVSYYFDVPGNTFSLRYALLGPAMGAKLPSVLFFSGLLAGWDRFCYAAPTAAFIVLGASFALRRRDFEINRDGKDRQDRPILSILDASVNSTVGRSVAQFALGSTGVMVLLYALYFFPVRRFLTPMVPLLMLLASVGVVATVDLQPSGWRRRRTVLCNVLCLWVIAEGLIAAGAGGAVSVPRRYETARLIERGTGVDAVIVSGIDPLFLGVTAGRQAVPISRRVEYASKVVLPGPIREAVPEDAARDPDRYAAWALGHGGRRPVEVVAAEAPDSVARYLVEGRPVYCDDFDLQGDDAPLRARFLFEPADSVAGVHLYRLRLP